MEYKKIDEHYVGFANLRIAEVFANLPKFFENQSILITCVDSTRDIKKLPKWLNYVNSKGKFWNAEIVGNSLWVDSKNVKDVFVEGKTFNGYDEIYLLKNKPPIDVKGHFTTDACFFNKELPKDILENIKKINATRFLADGGGLNFVCESLDLVKELEGLEKRLV